MNMAANMLGLDNAATPLGLKAMRQMQELNTDKDTASDDMIMFLVINASSVTIVPATILTFRAQLGAADPTDVLPADPDRHLLQHHGRPARDRRLAAA